MGDETKRSWLELLINGVADSGKVLVQHQGAVFGPPQQLKKKAKLESCTPCAAAARLEKTRRRVQNGKL
jgi:hypothetical protein